MARGPAVASQLPNVAALRPDRVLMGGRPLPLRDGPRSDLAMAARPIEALDRPPRWVTTDRSTVPTPCIQGGLRGSCDDPGRRRCAAHPDLRLDPLQRRAHVRAADARAPACPSPVGGRRRRCQPVGGRRRRPLRGLRAGRHRAWPPERSRERRSSLVRTEPANGAAPAGSERPPSRTRPALRWRLAQDEIVGRAGQLRRRVSAKS